MKTTDYKIKILAGIDDLSSFLAERATEWWTDEDLAKWNEGKEARRLADEAYIKKLKKDGEYGKEYFLTMTLIDNPMFDAYTLEAPAIESFTFDMMDFSKNNNNE